MLVGCTVAVGACVDSWATLHPAERFDWRGRSCYYKHLWNQCSKFTTVCASTCGMCSSKVSRVPASAATVDLVSWAPPAPPRSSWARVHSPPSMISASPPPRNKPHYARHASPPQHPPPSLPAPPGPPPDPPVSPMPRDNELKSCQFNTEYHIISHVHGPSHPSFVASVDVRPWLPGTIVNVHYTRQDILHATALSGARLAHRHHSGKGRGTRLEFELLAFAGTHDFSFAVNGTGIEFPDLISCTLHDPSVLPKSNATSPTSAADIAVEVAASPLPDAVFTSPASVSLPSPLVWSPYSPPSVPPHMMQPPSLSPLPPFRSNVPLVVFGHFAGTSHRHVVILILGAGLCCLLGICSWHVFLKCTMRQNVITLEEHDGLLREQRMESRRKSSRLDHRPVVVDVDIDSLICDGTHPRDFGSIHTMLKLRVLVLNVITTKGVPPAPFSRSPPRATRRDTPTR